MISGSPVVSIVRLIAIEATPSIVSNSSVLYIIVEVKFTKLPPRKVTAVVGTAVNLQWEYTVSGDRNVAFARYSPTWDLYANNTSVELASEDKNNNWKWSVSSTCPATLRERISKDSSAHLVISNVMLSDTGTYGCSLKLSYGNPLVDKVDLIVTGPTPCKTVVDLVFLLDGSASIERYGEGNFQRCLNFIKTIVRSFEVAEDRTHVGLAIFSGEANVAFTLIEHFDIASIEKAIDQVRYPGQQNTYTGEGLKRVKNAVFAETGRSQVPHVLIVMTDGQSADDVDTPSTALKNDGTLIYGLGIGLEYDLEQLYTMVSTPSPVHVFVAGFNDLATVATSIKDKACSATSKAIVPCKTTVDLGFLIDGSSSIENSGKNNFKLCKDFIKKMVAHFDVSQSGSHVGVMQFANQPSLSFGFNQYYDKSSLYKAIDDIVMLKGGIMLGRGLAATKENLFDAGSRANVHRILIVMTDGQSEDDTTNPSKAIRDEKVSIFCLGIGDRADIGQLKVIATDPGSDHVFKSGFDQLASVVESIERKACP
ncbi:hypothetical protein QZH41_013023, partial [Actinostola sp. cb2023]